jgi:acetyltransferase-like isoleucine patch superfamily enzyme
MSRAKLRRLAAMAVSALPTAALRRRTYNLFSNYRLGRGARTGLFAVIAVDRFECGDEVVIGRGVQFIGPMQVRIGARTLVGRHNRFECPPVAAHPSTAHMRYARRLTLGADCLVHEAHFFDVYGAIDIGDGTWIAGRESQFWTHGASVQDRDIHIGRNCYLGSAVRVAPGAGVGDRAVVGLGSVLASRISESDVIVAGVPGKVVRRREPGSDAFSFTRWDNAA